MSNTKSHEEKTSADSKSIGFDYQYYFFLWKVLKLDQGQSVGLEIKDDVHIEFNNELILYQLKHTIQKNAKGDSSNLTNLDSDMWKTFSNWSKLITDENDSRSDISSQLIFLKKTSFVLATNKSNNKGNNVIKALNSFQEGTKDINYVIDECQSLHDISKDITIKEYIMDVLNLDNQVRDVFLNKISFILNLDDLITNCKEAIRSKMIPLNKIDQAFAAIDSALRSDNFLQIKDKNKIEISFDIFYDKYRRYFDIHRNTTLKVLDYKGALPDKLEDQIFIKQLLEIGFVDIDDFEYITRLTHFKLKLLNNLDEWKREGEITDIEINQFKDNVYNLWESEFRLKNKSSISEEEYNDKAFEVLSTMLKSSFNLSGQELDVDMCNGKLYSLSDEPIIGWRKDWIKHQK